MAKKQLFLDVLADTRLSTDARIVILHVAAQGDGAHEISAREFSRLLNQAGERRVRQAVQDAVDVGWVERSEGGRGHHPRFAFTPAENAGLNDDIARQKTQGYPENSPAKNAGLNGNHGKPLNTDRLAENAELSDSPADTAELRGGRVRVSTINEIERRRTESAGEPVEVKNSLSDDVKNSLEKYAEILKGCRGSLTDYLERVVPPHKHYGYVMSVVGWLNGTEDVWRMKDGTRVPPEDRTARLAAALNDLLQDGEQDMKRRVGDVGNLRTKLSIVINPVRPSGNGNGSRSSSKPTPQKFEYNNPTEEFPGFTP